MISFKKAWTKIFINNRLSSISLCFVLLFASIFYLLICSTSYNAITSYSDYENNYGDYFISTKNMNYEEVAKLNEGIANSRIPIQGYAYNQHIGFCNDEYGYKISVNEIGGDLDLVFSRNLISGQMPLNFNEGLITKDYFDKIGTNIAIGDDITIDLYKNEDAEPQKITFKLVGILQHYYTDSDLNFLLGTNTENDNSSERSFDCFLYSKDYSTVLKSTVMSLSGADSYETIRRVIAYIFNVNDIPDLEYLGVVAEFNKMFVIASMDMNSSALLFGVAIFVFLAFSIILSLIVSITVRLSLNDRLSDLGIMNSIGLGIKGIRKALLIESTILSSLCIIFALPATLVLNKVIYKKIEPLMPTRYIKNELNVVIVIFCFAVVLLSVGMQYLLTYRKILKNTSKELINEEYKLNKSRKSEVFGKYGLLKYVLINNLSNIKQTINLFVLSVAAVLICLIAISFGFSMVAKKDATEDYLELGEVNTDYAVRSIYNEDLSKVNEAIKKFDITDFYTIDGLQIEVNGIDTLIDVYSDELLNDCEFTDLNKPLLIWVDDDMALYSEDYPFLTHIKEDTNLVIKGVDEVLHINGFLSMYMKFGDASLICNEVFYNTYLSSSSRTNYKTLFYSDSSYLEIHDSLIASGITQNTIELYPEEHGNYKIAKEAELFISIALILGVCMFIYHIISLYAVIVEKLMNNKTSNYILELLGMTQTQVQLINCAEVAIIVVLADIISLLISNRVTNVVLGSIYSNAQQPIILSLLFFVVQLFIVSAITFKFTSKYKDYDS